MTNPPAPPPLPAAVFSWRRVFVYTVVLFLATFAAGCLGGVVAGFQRANGQPNSTLALVLQVTLVPLATVLVFVWIGRVETALAVPHAAAVWALAMVLTFLLNVGVMGGSRSPSFSSASRSQRSAPPSELRSGRRRAG